MAKANVYLTHQWLLWITNFLTWAAIVLFIIGMPDKVMAMIIPFPVLYLIYIIAMFCSPTFKKLQRLNDGSEAYYKLKKYLKLYPTITFKSTSYHYNEESNRESVSTIHFAKSEKGTAESSEKITAPYSDEAIISRGNLKRPKIKTHRAQDTLPIYSCRDISGLIKIKKEFFKDGNPYIQLNLKYSVDFADPISYSDYINKKTEFWEKNRFRDFYMSFKESRIIRGFTDEFPVFVQISENKTCFNMCAFVIFSFITLGAFYTQYFDTVFNVQDIKIRKLVSTRFNLLSPENNEKYKSLQPALKIQDKVFTYTPEETGWTDNSKLVYVPSKVDLEEVQHYESCIPKYLAKEEEGCASGIVQDLPEFESINHNEPPPQFAMIKGDIKLKEEMINREGNNGGHPNKRTIPQNNTDFDVDI